MPSQTRNYLFHFLQFVCLLAAVMLLGETASAQTKLALVVGVEEYERDGFDRLNFAEEDALELKAELDKLGFKTEAIVGEK